MDLLCLRCRDAGIALMLLITSPTAMLCQQRAQRSCWCKSKAPNSTSTPSSRLTSESFRWDPHLLSAQSEGAVGVLRDFKDRTADGVFPFRAAEQSELHAVSRLHGGRLKESTRGSSALCEGGELEMISSSFCPLMLKNCSKPADIRSKCHNTVTFCSVRRSFKWRSDQFLCALLNNVLVIIHLCSLFTSQHTEADFQARFKARTELEGLLAQMNH